MARMEAKRRESPERKESKIGRGNPERPGVFVAHIINTVLDNIPKSLRFHPPGLKSPSGVNTPAIF